MKKVCLIVAGFAVALSVVAIGTEEASAIPAFKTEWDNLYLKKDSTDPKEKALAEKAAEVKCNICHVGKNKKDKNEYGKALDELLDKKADAKDVAKIQDALKKVGDMPSSKDDPNSKKFGDFFKEGELAP